MATTYDDVEIREISADETIPLRHSVLWPNHPISHIRIPEDNLGYHYGAFVPTSNRPVAVISVFKEPLPASATEGRTTITPAARFRKFACDPAFQRRGVGTKLLMHVFAILHELACVTIWCDARLSTVDWYKKRGMVTFGKTFFKHDIEYVRMLWSTHIPVSVE
ncbi:GCN5-related N-acetyltransferase [Amylocystis lapponica]|nr:GCN5-related N-acetyltransferase [Amylocystis lapponica]